MTVDRERVGRVLDLADLVLSPGGGYSAVTMLAVVRELRDLVAELCPDAQRPPPGGTGGGRSKG